MRHEAAGITTELFPKLMQVSGVGLQLTYHFEPGSVRDGVTLTVPLFSLNQVSHDRCEWLVPGMIKEKVHLLIKSLPQKIRRHCVPLPNYAAGFCERNEFGTGQFLDIVIADIRSQTGLNCLSTDFKFETLPVHLTMNFKIVDEHGRQLEMGRNLAQLRDEFGVQARESFQKIASAEKLSLLDQSQNKTRTGYQTQQTQQANPNNSQNNSPQNSALKATQQNQPLAQASRTTCGVSEPAFTHAAEKITSWSFGSLPELLEVQQGRQTLIGFPALVDKQSHCLIEVFDDPDEAQRVHRIGMRRLFALQLKEQIKFLEKIFPVCSRWACSIWRSGRRKSCVNKSLS